MPEDIAARAGRLKAEAAGVGDKTLAQIMAEKKARDMFTDMMAGAGVHADRMALEVMYWLPQDFLDLYQELYTRALRGTDGGTGDRGKAAQTTGELGKAARKTAGGQGKKYKKYWTVADEQVLELKSRVDKRLRSMTREIRDTLTEYDIKGGEKVIGTGRVKAAAAQCVDCGILLAVHWKFCPRCGLSKEISAEEAANRSSK